MNSLTLIPRLLPALALCLSALGLVQPAAGDPPVTNDLVCQYDAGAGVATNASGEIQSWNDLAPNAHHGTPAGTPVLAPNQINSLPAAQLRGSWLDLAGTFFAKEQYVVVRSPYTNGWGGYGAFLGRASGRGSTYVLAVDRTTFWNDQPPESVSKNGVPIPWAQDGNYGFDVAPIYAYMILKITVNDNATNAASYQIGRVDGMSCDMDIAEIIGYGSPLSSDDEALVGGYLADKYDLETAYPTAPRAKIRAFGPGAVIDGTNILWTVPYGTDVTSLSPTYTLSTNATCDKTSGSTHDFTSPVTYTVVSSDELVTNVYTVTVTVTPISSAKQILTFGPGATIDQNTMTIAWVAPYGSDLTSLSPTYTLSEFATGYPPSGTIRDFTTPQTYTVVAQDLSSNDYTVNAIVWDITNAMACWYDAGEGVATNAGGRVQTWEDQSGNGHQATVGSHGAPALVPDDINGRPAVHLRGNNNILDCAGGMFTKEQYVVVRSPNDNWNGGGSFLGRASTEFLAVRASSYNLESGTKGFWRDHWPQDVSKNGTAVTFGPVGNTGFLLDIITNYMILKIIVDDTATAANLSNYPYYQIGQNETLGSCDMDIAEIMGYPAELNSSQETLVGRYLSDKYALATAYNLAPFIAITNIAGVTNLPTGTTALDIAGTNNEFTVDMWWSNSLGGGDTVPFSAPDWTFAATVVDGANFITVYGSNVAGNVASASATVNVVPEPAAMGAVVALVVWGIRLSAPMRRRN